jgi:hypothetical protein
VLTGHKDKLVVVVVLSPPPTLPIGVPWIMVAPSDTTHVMIATKISEHLITVDG